MHRTQRTEDPVYHGTSVGERGKLHACQPFDQTNTPDVGSLGDLTERTWSTLLAHQASGGVVIRNSDGRLLMAAAKRFANVPNVLMAEALAARESVLLARGSGFEKVILELDNSELVNLLHSKAGERSQVAGLWHEIQELGRAFTSFSLSFVNREGNEAAYQCAKLTSVSSPDITWVEAFPEIILEKVDSDCNPAME